MIGVILALIIVPVAAGLACVALPARVAAGLTVAAGLISFALALAVVPAAAHYDLSYLPAQVGVLPQPGADARGVHRGHPDRLPVHRGQLRPVRRGSIPVFPGEAEQ
jgi:hypothetical protein